MRRAATKRRPWGETVARAALVASGNNTRSRQCSGDPWTRSDSVRSPGASPRVFLENEGYEVIGRAVDLVLPDLGLQHDTHVGFGAALAWPFVFPIGGASDTTVHRYTCEPDPVYRFKPHRLVIEPGITIASRTLVWLHPGYEFVWHRAGSPLGVLAGVGSTLWSGRFGSRRARLCTRV